jgi:hypothetical protein
MLHPSGCFEKLKSNDGTDRLSLSAAPLATIALRQFLENVPMSDVTLAPPRPPERLARMLEWKPAAGNSTLLGKATIRFADTGTVARMRRGTPTGVPMPRAQPSSELSDTKALAVGKLWVEVAMLDRNALLPPWSEADLGRMRAETAEWARQDHRAGKLAGTLRWLHHEKARLLTRQWRWKKSRPRRLARLRLREVQRRPQVGLVLLRSTRLLPARAPRLSPRGRSPRRSLVRRCRSGRGRKRGRGSRSGDDGPGGDARPIGGG